MTIIKVGNKEYTPEEIAGLRAIFKNDPVSTTVTSQPLYGPFQDGSGYGPFSYPGMRPDMFSAFQRPHTLARLLGVRPSRVANDKIGIMTGVTDGSGSNPADYCGDPPTAGQLKRCVQNYIFGKWFMKTRLNVLPEMGEYADYSDMEKRILNNPPSVNPFLPEIMQRIDISQNEGLQLANELFALGVDLERNLEKVLIRGNQTLAPASTQRGFFKEFNGLERQVVTGRVDIDTSVPCPGADSTIIAWGVGIDASVAGRTLPQTIVDAVYAKLDYAERIGMADAVFKFVGTSKLFRALTYIWACEYWTSRCAGSAGNPSFTDAAEIRRVQLEMFNGRYLLIDGKAYEYVFSDGIRSTRASATVWTDDNLFFLPVEWQGRRLLWLEYKPMDNRDILDFSEFGGAPIVKPINNGMFLVGTRHNGFCAEHLLAAKLRLILEAPMLAFAINTIQYSYQAEYRDPYPGTSLHFDGGATRWDGNSTVS